MLISVIQVKDYNSARQQIHFAQNKVDGVELRLDYSNVLDFNAIAALRREFNLPMILTLRKKSQGGFYQNSEEQRLQAIFTLCQSMPDYIDLEYDVPPHFLQKIKLHYPTIKLICSYHNFNDTPLDLVSLLQSMQNPCFYGYKIATHANKTLDALRMLQFVNLFHNKYSLTGICMGESGQSTRILSAIVGNAMNYLKQEESQATAPGQLTLHDMTVYHLQKLNTASKIYALLGDPVHLSVGHILHNQAIEFLQENAVYIKLRTTADDLPQVIEQCRGLPFSGFSITMPLKEAILPLLDEIDSASQPIKAINSIVVHQGKYIGFNTDGRGAMQALATRVDLAKQKIIILGAGGAARAIAYAALQQQAEVIILNRTLTKAKKLAMEFGCESGDLNSLQNLKEIKYTVLINTLPENVCSEQNLNVLPNTLAMDIVYQPMNTAFLKMTEKANCVRVFGYEMYIYQALMQIERWFQLNEKQSDKIKNLMKQYFFKEH